MAGLVPQRITLPDGLGEGDDLRPDLDALDVDLGDEVEPDAAQGAELELADGSVVVRIGPPKSTAKGNKFADNLADKLDEASLGHIADVLLRGIEADDDSRREWLETRAEGIKLLGLKIEAMRSAAGDGASPVEGMSQYRDTMLLEAVLRFQANALAELYPADGPVKVRNDDPNATTDEDDLADMLERDLNHFLTATDKDYIPDSDRALFRIGLDGCNFKKVYHDPIKRHPRSLSVNAEDLIVNNDEVSIGGAGRVTHRSFMRPSTLKRMQILGEYRDVPLGDPGYQTKNAVDEMVEDITGVRTGDQFEAKDRRYEILECYCELEIDGLKAGEPDGLEVPYIVTLEKESKQVLAIKRNWDEDDPLCLPKTYFVQYPYIRGLGFYGLGLSHLLGNTTNAVTAAKREFIDAGMFANFPGFLYSKSAGRQNSNEFRIPPGGGAPIETGGLPISQAVMPLPYKEPGPVFVQFIEQVQADGARLGGTSEVQVGEGRQDAPVGTTLALIEQAIKPMMAVHKRLHQAQAEEFSLLVERFREDPEAFWRFNRTPATQWDKERFIQAVSDYAIVPQADPNTASHLQRVMRNAALYQMVSADPQSYDLPFVRKLILRGIGFGQPDALLAKTVAPPPPDPKAQAAMISAQAALMDAQNKASDLQFKQRNAAVEDDNRDKDRRAKVSVAQMGLQKEAMIDEARIRLDAHKHAVGVVSDHAKQAQDHVHDVRMAALNAEHDRTMAGAGQDHAAQLAALQAGQEAQMAAGGMVHELGMAHVQHQHALELEKAKPKPAKTRADRASGGRVDEPPIPGARLAPDGNWYLSHEGKHYRVDRPRAGLVSGN